MAFAMVVQLPVTGAYGTDDEFDLRTQLEREFNAALIAEVAGECGRGETEAGRMSVYLESIADPAQALRIVKEVLTQCRQLHRASVILETRSDADPDEIDRQILWPTQPTPTVRVA